MPIPCLYKSHLWQFENYVLKTSTIIQVISIKKCKHRLKEYARREKWAQTKDTGFICGDWKQESMKRETIKLEETVWRVLPGWPFESKIKYFYFQFKIISELLEYKDYLINRSRLINTGSTYFIFLTHFNKIDIILNQGSFSN